MTNKAYIVANEEQEREVLEQFETKGYVWTGEGEKPTEFVPSHIEHLVEFPYALLDDGELSWCYMSQLDNQKIVYDGRKEEQMSDKYVVTQEFMNELEESVAQGGFVSVEVIEDLPNLINNWRISRENNESNNRLIAIIRWVNGEDVFEVEKPKKWIVRSKETYVGNEYLYFTLVPVGSTNQMVTITDLNSATRFDTKEEAQSWANTHQEVVEVVDV